MRTLKESLNAALQSDNIMESVSSAEIKKATDVLDKVKLTLQDLLALTPAGEYRDFDEAYEELLADSLPEDEVSKDELQTVYDVIHGLDIEPWCTDDRSEANFGEYAPSGLIKLNKYIKTEGDPSEMAVSPDNAEWILDAYNEGFFFLDDDGLQILLGIPKRLNGQAKKFVIALGNAIVS